MKKKNGRIMSLSNCAVCNSKKLRFIKKQEGKGLLSMIGKIQLLDDLLIWLQLKLCLFEYLLWIHLKI